MTALRHLATCAMLSLVQVHAHAAATPCELASAAAQRWAETLGARVDVQCRGQGIYQQAAIDALALASHAPRPRSGPQNWPVQVRHTGGRMQILQVPLHMTWTGPVWTLKYALPAGAALLPTDLELKTRTWQVGQEISLAAPDQPPHGRLPGALPAGAPLSPTRLLPEDQLPRGETVTVVVSERAVNLELPARLLESARPGNDVRVQVNGKRAVLQGRLDANHFVWVGTP